MTKPKPGTLVLSVAFVLVAMAAVNFYLGRDQERAKRVWTEGQLAKVTQAKEALEQERDELLKAKEALETQLTDATTQAKTLADQFAQEKRARESLTSELAQVRRETTDLKGRLETERKEKLTLTEELAKAKQSYQALGNELTTLRQAKEALEKRVKEMLSSQTGEAERIVVKPASASDVKSLEGKVLVVNREFNFVVVNLGSKDGIQAGTALAVYRGDKMLGKAQAEKIYDNMTAATLLSEETKGQIKEGDLVRVTS